MVRSTLILHGKDFVREVHRERYTVQQVWGFTVRILISNDCNSANCLDNASLGLCDGGYPRDHRGYRSPTAPLRDLRRRPHGADGGQRRSGLLRPPRPAAAPAPAQRPPRGACGHGAAGQSQPQGAALRPAAEVAWRGRRGSAGPPYPQPARWRAACCGARPRLSLRGALVSSAGGLPAAVGRRALRRDRPAAGRGSDRSRRAAGSPRAGREEELPGLGGGPCERRPLSAVRFVGAGAHLQVFAKIWDR